MFLLVQNKVTDYAPTDDLIFEELCLTAACMYVCIGDSQAVKQIINVLNWFMENSVRRFSAIWIGKMKKS